MNYLVQQYFSQSATAFPDKAAINCEQESATYKESDLLTNAIGNHLRQHGLRRGSFVPFFMKKGVNAIHAMLSILKSDCAYVPIDVNSPAARVSAIIAACDAELVIVDSASKSHFESLVASDSRPTLFVIDEFENGDTSTPLYENLSIDIAYVLFTSGSTGTPKGVMIPHKAIIDYIEWCVIEYELRDTDVIANHAPLYFDNSTFDIYTAFWTGAELHLVDENVNAILPSLIKWIANRKITTFFCVPSVLAMLLKSRRLKKDSFPDLRHLICAGEVLHPNVLASWMELFPHVQFTNMYGPTEITVDCSYHVIMNIPDAKCKTIPIGKARPNMELFVRNDAGEMTKDVGSRGELLVRGTSVAYGYLGDRTRTSESFIQNPMHDLFFDPLYRTGDTVEIDDNHNFLFLGRSDQQIKYLGHRIELGEIEAIIVQMNGVNECVVVFNQGETPDSCEIGSMISAVNEASEREILSALPDQLPKYMIPTNVVIVSDDLPRTPNGKYDRKLVKMRLFGEN